MRKKFGMNFETECAGVHFKFWLRREIFSASPFFKMKCFSTRCQKLAISATCHVFALQACFRPRSSTPRAGTRTPSGPPQRLKPHWATAAQATSCTAVSCWTRRWGTRGLQPTTMMTMKTTMTPPQQVGLTFFNHNAENVEMELHTLLHFVYVLVFFAFFAGFSRIFFKCFSAGKIQEVCLPENLRFFGRKVEVFPFNIWLDVQYFHFFCSVSFHLFRTAYICICIFGYFIAVLVSL